LIVITKFFVLRGGWLSSGLILPGGRPAVKTVKATVDHENIQVFVEIPMSHDLAFNRRCFLVVLKGLISCYKSQKKGFSM
jgi:hypothetical protein